MAFPVVAGATDGSSATVTLPSSIAAGDLLVILVFGIANDTTPPSGWTLFGGGAAEYAHLCAYCRIADGSEDTVSFSGWEGEWGFLETNAYRITGHGGTIEAAFASVIDPPAVTASWGSADNLFITACGTVDNTPSGNPANYGSQVANADVWSLRSLRRELASASDNPSSFTVSGGYEAGCAITLVIGPAAGEPTAIDIEFAVTEPNESLSATATNLATGSASFTEPNETLSAAASHPVLGEAEFTEPNETLSSTVAGATFANAAFTEPNETIEAEASHPVVGNAAFTEDGETLEGAASNPIAASAIITEPVESLSAAAGVAVVADADFTEPDETVGATVDAGGGGFGRSYLRQINIGRVGIGL